MFLFKIFCFFIFLCYVTTDNENGRLNPLFLQLVDKFVLHNQSHILIQREPLFIEIDGYELYSAYGVFFSRYFQIGPHIDYQCHLCNGDFKAMMVPKYLHPMMAQVCSHDGCEEASSKGYFMVDVCKEHWTAPGITDRIQINIYFTNATECKPLGQLDEFDCEALSFGSVDEFRQYCTTTNAFLAPLVDERNYYWERL